MRAGGARADAPCASSHAMHSETTRGAPPPLAAHASRRGAPNADIWERPFSRGYHLRRDAEPLLPSSGRRSSPRRRQRACRLVRSRASETRAGGSRRRESRPETDARREVCARRAGTRAREGSPETSKRPITLPVLTIAQTQLKRAQKNTFNFGWSL